MSESKTKDLASGGKKNSKDLVKDLLNKLTKYSFLEKRLKKNASMRERELIKHKNNSLKISVFVGLFAWLAIGVLQKNLLLSSGAAVIVIALIFIFLIQFPLAKRKAHSKKVEAELPLFLMRLATEISIGKGFLRALNDCCKEESIASTEFRKVLDDIHNGASFQEALSKMNERLCSINVRRACSNLSNLQLQGKKDSSGLKRLAQELLLKQRIESKEFSGKMVVFALVFIAVSAIVPAMFQSFILIGSYFMKISFTAQQVFLISVVLFPVIDMAVLMMINSKTPLFLRQ